MLFLSCLGRWKLSHNFILLFIDISVEDLQHVALDSLFFISWKRCVCLFCIHRKHESNNEYCQCHLNSKIQSEICLSIYENVALCSHWSVHSSVFDQIANRIHCFVNACIDHYPFATSVHVFCTTHIHSRCLTAELNGQTIHFHNIIWQFDGLEIDNYEYTICIGIFSAQYTATNTVAWPAFCLHDITRSLKSLDNSFLSNSTRNNNRKTMKSKPLNDFGSTNCRAGQLLMYCSYCDPAVFKNSKWMKVDQNSPLRRGRYETQEYCVTILRGNSARMIYDIKLIGFETSAELYNIPEDICARAHINAYRCHHDRHHKRHHHGSPCQIANIWIPLRRANGKAK